jgi:cysteine desulfurase
MINFDLAGICVSAGSACSSGTVKESRVLQAMNVEKEFLNGAIRVSLGAENTKEEVEKFIEIWGKFFRRQFYTKF